MKGQILFRDEGGMSNAQAFKENAKQLVYLCGSDKFHAEAKFVGLHLSDVDYFISDGNLPENIKQDYKTTQFICTK